VVPRVCDLDALAASSSGKVEIESIEEGARVRHLREPREGRGADGLQGQGRPDTVRDVVTAFEEGTVAHTGEDVTSGDVARLLDEVPALRAPVLELTGGDESPAAVAAAVEFVLEGCTCPSV
jgi:magnesium chelatase subunit I